MRLRAREVPIPHPKPRTIESIIFCQCSLSWDVPLIQSFSLSNPSLNSSSVGHAAAAAAAAGEGCAVVVPGDAAAAAAAAVVVVAEASPVVLEVSHYAGPAGADTAVEDTAAEDMSAGGTTAEDTAGTVVRMAAGVVGMAAADMAAGGIAHTPVAGGSTAAVHTPAEVGSIPPAAADTADLGTTVGSPTWWIE